MRIQGDNFGQGAEFKYQIHDKRYIYPLHIHQFAELVVLLDGEFEVTVDSKKYRLNTGDVALILPYQSHKFYSRDRVRIAMYLFSPALIPDFFSSCDGRVAERAVFTLSDAARDVFEKNILNESNLSLYSIKAFLYLVFEDYLENSALIEGVSDSKVVAKVAAYINQHFAEQINLSEVAAAIGYSSNYLSHCIQSTLGLNFCSLLACLRVEKARQLLSETDKPSIDICFECGFGSERSFHRQFKSITGRTPGEYRANFACGSITRPHIKYF